MSADRRVGHHRTLRADPALPFVGLAGDGLYGTSVIALLVTMKLCTLLGALLIFARSVLYPAYAGRSAAWGLSPLEDQQLAGLLMMPIGGIVYLVAALIIFGLWLGDMERRSPSRRAEIERATDEIVAQKMMHGH